MTLMLDIPQRGPDGVEADKRLRAANALHDARMLTQGQAAEVAGLPRRSSGWRKVGPLHLLGGPRRDALLEAGLG